jgi:hypothetical protein
MNPELKKIGNKLFLGTQKVELGLLQDFKKLSDSYFAQSSKFNLEVDKIKNGIKSMQTEFIALQKKVSELDSEYQKAKRLSLDLGVEVPAELDNEYKKALSLLKNDSSIFKEYNK